MKITLEFNNAQELQQFMDDPDAVFGKAEPADNPTTLQAPPAPPQRGRGRPRNAATAAPAAPAAPAPGAPQQLTLDQVREKLMVIRNHDGSPDRVRNLVKSVAGVDQVAEIPPEKFNALAAAAQDLIAQLQNGGGTKPAQSFEI